MRSRYAIVLSLVLSFVALSAHAQGIVISQVYGGGGSNTVGAAYTNDYVELYNPSASAVTLTGHSLQYGSSTGGFNSIYVFPATTIDAGRYLAVKLGTTGTAGATFTADRTTTSINMAAGSGKIALARIGTALGCGATATPCALPHADIVDLVSYGASNNAEGSAPVNNGVALTSAQGALRKLNGCQDTANNHNDFTVVTIATGLVPRTASSPQHACLNSPPTITAPSNPVMTVTENTSPFAVNLTGNDDGGIYTWAATAGTGVSSVVVSAGQGTGNVTYTVTLQTNFYGTATFTASLSDTVHPTATQVVNIAVSRDMSIDHAPVITAPANPITAVAQGASPFPVNISGSDDNGLYTWSATLGAGVTNVSVTAGQGTANVTYTVTINPLFTGTATFNALLSDGVNPPASQAVNIAVSPSGSAVSHLVISQVYGGGGNTGATYTHDFVEIYNPTGTAVNMAGWTLQYASATNTGSFFPITPLGGIVGPGEYFLVGLASGGTNGSPLSATNLNGDINLSATNGKIALVRNGDTLSGTCGTLLTDLDIVDFVGFGTANCSETANAPAPSNTTSLWRANGGNTDTDHNLNDFSTATPAPRRTSAIQEIGPAIATVDPSNNSTIAPRDANLTITFTETVDVTGAWFNVNCTVTGLHNSATYASATTPRTWVIIPNVNFLAGELCTVTIYKDFVRDTDTDDATAGTDNLASDYSWSFTVATGTAPAYPSGVHLTMGNPSAAVADTNVPNNYLMVKPELSLSYNLSRGTPNWVSWHLADEWVGTLTRNDTFRADPEVLPSWYRVLASDYSGSGFDRGHMVPNADRDKETSIPINQATFLMTNMLPQAPDNNQGPWANMENYLRTLLPANELYIVAGGAGTGGTGSNGFFSTIANGNVTVPAQTWKVVMVLPKAGGDDVSRVTATTRTIAVLMPNTNGIRTGDPNDWLAYLTTVDAVETLTGYDFFANVADAVEAAIESGTNGTNRPVTRRRAAGH